MAKPPQYIQKKVRELHRTGLFKIPELEESGWRIKPLREFRWVWHFRTERKYNRWLGDLIDVIENLGYYIWRDEAVSADEKVKLLFDRRDIGRETDYIRAVIRMVKLRR